MIGADFRVGELEVGFPGHFGEVDGKAIGDNHDCDPAKIGGPGDEF